jgi:hypothetical protein
MQGQRAVPALPRHGVRWRVVNSTTAGAGILAGWGHMDEWNGVFGIHGAQLFGMVLWVTLFDDAAMWRQTLENMAGGQARVYRRA